MTLLSLWPVDPRCKGQKDLCWTLEVWADLRTKHPVSVVWVTSMDLESEWIGSWYFSGYWGTGCCWKRPHIFRVREKTQTHSCLPFVSGVWVRALELSYVGPSTQHPALVLCIFRISGGIRYLIKWVVTGWHLVLIPPPICCVSWGKSFVFSLHRD